MEKPPGLGSRPQGSVVEMALKKGWSTLTKDVQDALKAVGIDYTPEPELQPLEEVLKANLEALPSEVRTAVEGLLQPPQIAQVDVTGQLKATVGELRQLSQRKQSLQKKVDNAKEQYKVQCCLMSSKVSKQPLIVSTSSWGISQKRMPSS